MEEAPLDEAPLDGPESAAPAARGVYVEKPRANVYTMMLIVSFVALVLGCVFLAGEMAMYNYDFKATSAKAP